MRTILLKSERKGKQAISLGSCLEKRDGEKKEKTILAKVQIQEGRKVQQ